MAGEKVVFRTASTTCTVRCRGVIIGDSGQQPRNDGTFPLEICALLPECRMGSDRIVRRQGEETAKIDLIRSIDKFDGSEMPFLATKRAAYNHTRYYTYTRRGELRTSRWPDCAEKKSENDKDSDETKRTKTALRRKSYSRACQDFSKFSLSYPI